MHIPRKRFGQNFLVDSQIVMDIVRAIHPSRADLLVEIGPGLGALTRPLLQSLDHLQVVEIDRDIVERLRREFSEKKLTVYSAEALNSILPLWEKICGLLETFPTIFPRLSFFI